MCEIGADQQRARLGHFVVCEQILFHPLITRPKQFANLQVALAKFRKHLLKLHAHLFFREAHHARANIHRALFSGEIEGPDQHTRAIRIQDGAGPSDLNDVH